MVNQQPTSLIHTTIGKIAIYQKEVDSNKIPFIFLHGVYFDHHLWDKVIDSVNDRTIIALDMPLHGLSKEITKNDWSLNDCADMLLEILDHLKIAKVIAVGHSWGSMTILRAASKQPERFENVLLCNMPFLAATKKQKITFVLQHSMLIFRNFYTKQVAKALFGKTLFKENPSLIEDLKRPMNLLSNAQIKQTDKAVIIDAEDASELIKNLKVRAVALKGVEDYVPAPPNIETIVIGGGHISPLEKPDEILSLVKKISN
ncbi:MAG: alpha/beta fold hydrolase [Bacteroidota bacterium]|jgi:3-oxoadipate enol-lactonase